jgi:hypothetical protein
MADNVKLRLSLTDVYGKPLKEKVDVILRSLDLSNVTRNTIDSSTKVDLAGLHGAPQGRYRIEVDPPSYQLVTIFFNMKASGITPLGLTFPVDLDKITKVNFPLFPALPAELRRLLENSANVLAFIGKSGADLYTALDDIRRAGLLNIATKCGATNFENGRNVLSYVQELKELRGDRFFAVVPKELREETKNSVSAKLFQAVDESLHHPPDGFSHAGSFKTGDHAGNLQLTFFMRGDDCVADIDIDDANGFEHIFQVLHNSLTGQPTHPYNIHEILVGVQHLDPGYTFVL